MVRPCTSMTTPPHDVVRGGHDRDRLRAHVDAELQQRLWMLGKRSTRKSAAEVRHVEDDVVVAGALQLGVDGARDDVARREVASSRGSAP